MTTLEMHNAFEIELKRKDSKNIIDSNEILHWLNDSIRQFVKTRFTGNNQTGDGFEQTQKRIDDLRTLVTSDTTASPVASGNKYTISLPSDYLYLVNDYVDINISSLSITDLRQSVTEIDKNGYNSHIDNPFSEHKLNLGKAKPLRFFTESGVVLETDGNYTISNYYLEYIKEPDVIDYSTNCNLPEHTHDEIVQIAVRMCLENISDNRYQSYTIEENKNE